MELFLPDPLRKLSSAFGLCTFKSGYTHYFSKGKNINYVGPNQDSSYYGVNELSDAERTEFLEWHKGTHSEVFEKRHVPETYSQNEFNVLRQAYRLSKRDFFGFEISMYFWKLLLSRPHLLKCCVNSS